MKKRILISTGGSGGHVIPAAVFYDQLKSQFEVSITTDRRGAKFLNLEKYKANIINTPKFEGSVYLIVDVVQLIIDLAVLQHSCGIYKTFFNLLSPAEEQRLVLNEVVSIFLTDGRYGRRKKSSHSILYDLALF